jgi:predicted ATPase
MARRGFTVMPEPGRQIVREQLRSGGDALPWENKARFAELCIRRAVDFYHAAPVSDRPVWFDRSYLDNICGLERLGLPIPDVGNEALVQCRYAPTVFLTPPWRELFVADAERRHGFDDAVAEYEALKTAYTAHGYEIVRVPKGPVAARARFLERKLGL